METSGLFYWIMIIVSLALLPVEHRSRFNGRQCQTRNKVQCSILLTPAEVLHQIAIQQSQAH